MSCQFGCPLSNLLWSPCVVTWMMLKCVISIIIESKCSRKINMFIIIKDLIDSLSLNIFLKKILLNLNNYFFLSKDVNFF